MVFYAFSWSKNILSKQGKCQAHLVYTKNILEQHEPNSKCVVNFLEKKMLFQTESRIQTQNLNSNFNFMELIINPSVKCYDRNRSIFSKRDLELKTQTSHTKI